MALCHGRDVSHYGAMTTGGGTQPPEEAVFLRDFTDIDRPLDVVKLFLSNAELLAPLARAAAAEANLWLSLVAGRPPRRQRLPPTHVRLGPWRAQGDRHIIAMRWETPAIGAMFPFLDGDIELAPLGAEQSRLVLNASYRAPPTRAQRMPDLVALHRAGESAVRTFLQHVAETFGGDQ